LVTDYDRKASPGRRKILEIGMLRHDTPLLAGLRHVLETALEGAWEGALGVAHDHSRTPASLAIRGRSPRFTWSASGHGPSQAARPAVKSLHS
jgi:hypothetical protein